MLSANINGVWRSSVLGGDPSTGPLLSLLGGSPVRSPLAMCWVLVLDLVTNIALYIWTFLKGIHLLGLSSLQLIIWVLLLKQVTSTTPRTSPTRVPSNLQKGGDM